MAFKKARDRQIEGMTQDDEGRWHDDHFFVFLADPQPGLIDKVNGGNGSTWDVEIKRTHDAVEAINKMRPKPKFVCIGGDLIDAFPGESLRDPQVSDLKSAFADLDQTIPIVVVSGNHDVGNVPTMKTMSMYNNDFGEDYYSFWVEGVFYIVVNSQYMYNDSETREQSSNQDSWLRAQLEIARLSSCQHVVVFMHIPLFLQDPDEEDSYFAIPGAKRMDLLTRYSDAGIKIVFSGHYHRNAGGFWRNERGDKQVEVVVSSAIGAQLGNDVAGLRVVKVTADDITHTYYPLDGVPERLE
uniref:serine/threonine-protein phosphatase CPPED1-like n=1 Tax=Ciona intestinalis TaxID=7719 RepID=UPI000180C5F4|nr:serine/threonine-protein phosphatase CPPED1-like [Ciona intestinalis]|eukprot:XP_002123287.1 serine/threonine-protein phosphatase CPPED1-like [Ciona intestinalis]